MAVDEKTRDALDLRTLKLPERIRVDRIEVEDYTDTSGDAALRVLVVLNEATEVEKLTGQMVGDLKWAIRQSLQEHGITLFAYIFLAKQSELDEAEQED